MSKNILSPNFNDAWEGFLHQLSFEFGFSSALYISCHVATSLERTFSATRPSLWITSYPKEYVDAVGIEQILENDYSVRHCVEKKSPLLWHDDSFIAEMREGEIARWKKDTGLNFEIGVSVPVFKKNGAVAGGFGLLSGDKNKEDFEQLWAINGDKIWNLCQSFDREFRHIFAIQTYGLSAQEIKTLNYAAAGMASEKIAANLELSKKTVESYLLSARRKTKSQNTAEAVAKAISYGII